MHDESTERLRARTTGIATKEVGGEVVAYDLETDKVHLLNPVTSTIWRLAAADDGVTAAAATAAVAADFPDQDAPGDLTLAAIQELRAVGLLVSDTGTPSLAMLDRRQLLKIAAGAAVLGPLVTTILAPPAAATHSGPCHALGTACTTTAQCCNSGTTLVCYSNACVNCLANGVVCNGLAACCTGQQCQNYTNTTTSVTTSACCTPNGSACTPNSTASTVCCSGNCATTCALQVNNQVPRNGDQAMCASGTIRTVGNSGGGGGTLGQCCATTGTTISNANQGQCCTSTRASGACT